MLRGGRATLVGIGVFALICVTAVYNLAIHNLAAPTEPWMGAQLERQTDASNVTFSQGPYSRFQLANMRYHGLDSTKVATMMEFRANPQIVPHLLHMMSVLDDDWPFRIYHSLQNAFLFEHRQFQKHIATGKLTLIPLNLDLSNHNAVSNFLAHKPLWENLAPAQNILIFQPDSIICSRSEAKVEDFFEYDYVGAPVHERFAHSSIEEFYMNGGFSLRKRESMLGVIEKFNSFSHADNDGFSFEDQYFVSRLREMNGSLPTREKAMTFSVETIYYETPLGVHQVERYFNAPHEAEMVRALKEDWCPEMHLLYGRVGPAAFVCDRASSNYNEVDCAAQKGTTPAEATPQHDDSPTTEAVQETTPSHEDEPDEEPTKHAESDVEHIADEETSMQPTEQTTNVPDVVQNIQSLESQWSAADPVETEEHSDQTT